MPSYQDDPSWWGGVAARDREGLSLVGLVQNGTLDLRIASLLWLLAENKASIVVAAGPRLVGKTTLLMAIVDLLPPWYLKVLTRGRQEDFSFLAQTDPVKTVILVPELSDHTPAYLWGDAVLVLFQALDRGFSVAATLHADTPEEVVAALVEGPLRSRPGLAGRLDAIVNLWMGQDHDVPVRRVSRLTLVRPSVDGEGPRFFTLSEWDHQLLSFAHASNAEAYDVLGERLGLPPKDLQADLSRRTAVLGRWLDEGHTRGRELRKAALEYYRSRG